MRARVGLIDYGAGNFSSVLNALVHLGLECRPARDRDSFEWATHLVLPGVGSFDAAMTRLEQLDLVERIRDAAQGQRRPLLGICVGMQVLATVGREFGERAGLDLVPGSVERLECGGLRIPHMGWNELEVRRAHPLLDTLPERPVVYFAHSYGFRCDEEDDVVAVVDYGGDVSAVIGRGSICGVQFHPEKSQHDGLGLLRRFAAIDPDELASAELPGSATSA